MKKIQIIIIIALLGIIPIFTTAQNELDALKYMNQLPGGSARSTAMGGAFGALGADPSALSTNPAGLGVYQRTEFSITPGFMFTNIETSYLNTHRTDYDFNMNINNLAYVVQVYESSGNQDHTSVNLGFSYNRLNNFNSNIAIEGQNHDNSLTDWFAARATQNGLHYGEIYDEDPNFSRLAWETYLIDLQDGESRAYESAFDNRGQNQRILINNTGYMGEYNFSVAANFMHQLFIGASVGIQSIRYKHSQNFLEVDQDNLITGFNELTYKENIETRGRGLNLKLGVLYRPVKWVRFGAALHTPTFLSLSENYSSSMNSKFSVAPNVFDSIPVYNYNEFSPQSRFDYQLNTPYRAMLNLAFIIENFASVSIDYEYVNYTQARLRSDTYPFFDENENIRNYFSDGHNLRVGAEYRLGPIALRAGGAYLESPFNNQNINKNSYTLAYSGGFGIRGSNMFFDLSYTQFMNERYYLPYQAYELYSPESKINTYRNRVVATLGFIF